MPSKVMKAKRSTPVLKFARKNQIRKLTKPRSTEGREEAKAAAKMTKEQWSKFQTAEYKKAWPKPEYMIGAENAVLVRDGGEGAYRDATFEVVTRWMAHTKISYRPHAKAPGSKSHVRYEKYSKAKTVAQALKLGSWPLDWVFDYEHGFIKVHGPVRKEPLDISQHTGKLDDVDLAIANWHRKELAKKHGLRLQDLYVDKGAGESVIMRCHRLVADRQAEKFLKEAAKKKRAVSDDEVEKVLQMWAFRQNTARQNVMPRGTDWVWSDTVGLLRDRTGDVHLTDAATRYPNFTQIFNRWLHDRLPQEVASFGWTSLNLNCNYSAKRHRDGNNLGPSCIKAFGTFSGGKLGVWPRDGKSVKNVKQLHAKDKESVDLRQHLVMFNGNSAHEVEDFEGNRYSVVFFALGCHAKAKEEDRVALRKLGFNVPAKSEDPHRLLRKPNSDSKIPALRKWVASRLAQRPAGGRVLKGR